MDKPFRVSAPGAAAKAGSDEPSLAPLPPDEPRPLGMSLPESPDPLQHPHSKLLPPDLAVDGPKPFKLSK